MLGDMEKWRRFREAVVVIDDLDVALAVWGLTAPRAAALVAFLLFLIGMTVGQGIFLSLFAGIIAFPAVMIGLIKIHEWREKVFPPPDFDRWRNVEIFPLWMAASLWAGRNPTPTITPNSRIYPYLHQLKSAAAVGRLTLRDDERGNEIDCA